MSSVPVDPRVSALLRAGSSDLSSADPNVGGGAEWPTPGLHDVFVLSSSEKEGKFKYTNSANVKVEVPCVEISFEYEVIPDPKHPDFDPTKKPLVFTGERFQLVPNFKSVLTEENQVTRARIQWDRFAGHVTKMLNIPKEECTDAMATYLRVKNRLAENTRLAVTLDVRIRESESKGKKYTNRTEFVNANLSAPV